MHLKHFYHQKILFLKFSFFFFQNFCPILFDFILILFNLIKYFFSKKFAMNSVHELGSRTMSKN